MYKRALAIREKALGPEHRQVGMALNGRKAAIPRPSLCTSALLPFMTRRSAPEHPEVATSLSNLANLLRGARPLFRSRAFDQTCPRHIGEGAQARNILR